jgi:hypothetical protein
MKYEKNNGYITVNQMYICDNIWANYFIMRNFSNTVYLYSINIFRTASRISDKVENMIEQNMPDIVTRYMCFYVEYLKLQTHTAQYVTRIALQKH